MKPRQLKTTSNAQTYIYSEGKWIGYPKPTMEQIVRRMFEDFGEAFIKLSQYKEESNE